MSKDFVPNADPIIAEWITHEGGIRVFAYTDNKGKPQLAVTSFDKDGRVTMPTRVIDDSQYNGQGVIGNSIFTYSVPFIVSVSADELMLFVQPPPEFGRAYVTYTPWKGRTLEPSQPPQTRNSEPDTLIFS